MTGELGKISDYLISYYKINDKTPFIIKEVSANELLCNNRFDLGAKLYYLNSFLSSKNCLLAERLYDSHIAAFQDGIIEEHGNRKKKGYQAYHSTFEDTIRAFQTNTFDMTQSYIPVDKNLCLLDGAHRVACSIYFHKPVKIIIFPTLKGYTYDKSFFQKRGLERGYIDLMEYTLLTYGLDISSKYESLSHAKETLKISQKEDVQAIEISQMEWIRCKIIRFVRNRYTRMVINIKKLLNIPI